MYLMHSSSSVTGTVKIHAGSCLKSSTSKVNLESRKWYSAT